MHAYKIRQGFVFADSDTARLHDDLVVLSTPNSEDPQLEPQNGVSGDSLICFATDLHRLSARQIIQSMEKKDLSDTQVANIAHAYFEFSGGRWLTSGPARNMRPSKNPLSSAIVTP